MEGKFRSDSVKVVVAAVVSWWARGELWIVLSGISGLSEFECGNAGMATV